MTDKDLTIDWYEFNALKTSQYKRADVAAMALAAEAGEVLGKLVKCIRDNDGNIDEELRIAVAYELGDVLWHIPVLARMFGFTLQDIAEMNIKKLADRYKRGVINGSGDDR